ncbi:MAG: phycobilisome linker polypeptide [Cyanobacteria bacterium P01_H01_bin.15]
MNVTGAFGVSSYGQRPVSITVTGVCKQDVMKTSNYKIRVPLNQMSQVMQSINRMGGKVSAVSVDDSKGLVETNESLIEPEDSGD